MGRCALVVVLALTACHGWYKHEVALEAAFSAEVAADWHQTEHITAVCAESNPFLGDCGQHSTPTGLYFPLTYVFHLAVAELLPAGTIRTVFLSTSLVWESIPVVRNYRAGYY